MDWSKKIIKDLQQGKTVTFRSPALPALEENETISVVPYNPNDLAVEDLVLAEIFQKKGFYQVKNIKNGQVYISFPRSLDAVKVNANSIFGKVVGREIIFNKTKLNGFIETIGQVQKRFEALKVENYEMVDTMTQVNSKKVIWLLTGSKENWNDPTLFWINCLEYLETKKLLYADAYGAANLCEFLSFNKLKLFIEAWFQGVKGLQKLNWITQVKKAMLMSDDCDDEAALVETEKEYIAIFRHIL